MTESTWSAVEGMAAARASRVAVIGASGYGGLQTLRLLQGHPALSVTFLGGERSAGQRWSSVCSFLPLPDDPLVESADPDRIAEVADFAVLSLPNGLACRMAPELIASKPYLGPPVDVWALGALMYELVHNKIAFRGESMAQLHIRIRKAAHAPFAPETSSKAKKSISVSFGSSSPFTYQSTGLALGAEATAG